MKLFVLQHSHISSITMVINDRSLSCALIGASHYILSARRKTHTQAYTPPRTCAAVEMVGLSADMSRSAAHPSADGRSACWELGSPSGNSHLRGAGFDPERLKSLASVHP